MDQTTIAARGTDLKVGDVIFPWGERAAVITELHPYPENAPLAPLFPGARVAKLKPHGHRGFAYGSLTIERDRFYKVMREAEPERYSPHPLDHLDDR